MNNVIKIHPDDNVVVMTTDVSEGDVIRGEDIEMLVNQDLSLGDKVALHDLSKGDHVYKYGLAIGSTNKSITQGEWVHLHNMQSDYVPTYVFNGSDEQA